MNAGTDSDWEKAKQQAVNFLRKKAREDGPPAKQTVTYKQFVKRIKAITLEYHGDPRLAELLDEISLDEDKAGRGLISVLVVQLAFPHLPSDGFFDLAAPRHPPGTKRREIFELELDVVRRANA